MNPRYAAMLAWQKSRLAFARKVDAESVKAYEESARKRTGKGQRGGKLANPASTEDGRVSH